MTDSIAQIDTHKEIPVEVYDLSDKNLANMEPGFYYNIPLNPETGALLLQSDIFLVGPYPSREACIEAAKLWIDDSLTDYLNEQEVSC